MYIIEYMRIRSGEMRAREHKAEVERKAAAAVPRGSRRGFEVRRRRAQSETFLACFGPVVVCFKSCALVAI